MPKDLFDFADAAELAREFLAPTGVRGAPALSETVRE